MMRFVHLAPLALVLLVLVPAAALAGVDQDYQAGMDAARKGDMVGAITALTRIIETSPPVEAKKLAVVYNLRGLCHEAKNEQQDALADYSKAIELDPKLADALGNRAMLYDKMGDKFRAKEDATAARRIDRKVKVPEIN